MFPVLNCRLDALVYPWCRASLSMDAPALYPVASLHLPGSSPTRQSAGIQGRVAGIVSRLAGPDAAGAVHVRRRRSPPPAMPSQPRWSPPDPQRPWPCPAGTLPTTTPTVDRGWLRRHPPRAVAGVASWRRPGAPALRCHLGGCPRWAEMDPTSLLGLARQRFRSVGDDIGSAREAAPTSQRMIYRFKRLDVHIGRRRRS